MHFSPPSRFRSAAILYFILSLSAWASTSNLESLGDNTFAITRKATNGFDRDVAKFKKEAEQDAAKYCADQGKVLHIVAVTSNRPHFGGGFSSARIVFRALPPGDPALTAPEPPPAPAAKPVTVSGVLPTYSGDLYAEILKLDDLRKRGLITDKEFEQQKKKLLKRTR